MNHTRVQQWLVGNRPALLSITHKFGTGSDTSVTALLLNPHCRVSRRKDGSVFEKIVVEVDTAVIEEQAEGRPSGERVTDGEPADGDCEVGHGWLLRRHRVYRYGAVPRQRLVSLFATASIVSDLDTLTMESIIADILVSPSAWLTSGMLTLSCFPD